MWNTTAQLHNVAELIVQEAWQESLLPQEEVRSDGNFRKDRIPRFPVCSKWLVLRERPVRIRLSHLLIKARTPSSPRAFSCILSYEVMPASF